MAVFLALIVPLPFTIKRKLFAFISESPIIAKLQYGLKVVFHCLDNMLSRTNITQITFIFILILFLDSVNRVYRVQQELAAFSKDGAGVG
jgi:hypothetical protein